MSLKHVQICFIHKQKYAYLKAIKSEKQTNTAVQNRYNVQQYILESKYPSFLNIPIISKFKLIQSITTVKQIYQFCIHAIHLLPLVFKRASLYN